MARIIPNQNSYIAYLPTIASSTLNPTLGEITGAGSVDLTRFVVSINASTRANIVQTPDFGSRFETNILGTIQSTFEMDLYRDSTTDTAWTTLVDGLTGYIVVSRYPGTNAILDPNTGFKQVPGTGDSVEVWPIAVASRAMQNMTSNTVEQFTVMCAVPQLPNESATVG